MLDLQTIWFLLIGVLLVGYAILDGFDLGVGMLHLFVAKTDHERRIVANAVGPVWDGNEVWLLTGGGAIFAAFPGVYATVFSGFYLALMLVLAALIFRAVSLEFRSKEASPRWRASWDWAFALGSALPALLFGVAIGNILRGLPLNAEGDFTGTFLSLLNPFALLVGLLSTAMFLMQGGAWLLLKTEGEVAARARRAALGAWTAFAVLWVVATIAARSAAPQIWAPYGEGLPWVAPTVLLAAVVSFPLALRAGRRGLDLRGFVRRHRRPRRRDGAGALPLPRPGPRRVRPEPQRLQRVLEPLYPRGDADDRPRGHASRGGLHDLHLLALPRTRRPRRPQLLRLDLRETAGRQPY